MNQRVRPSISRDIAASFDRTCEPAAALNAGRRCNPLNGFSDDYGTLFNVGRRFTSESPRRVGQMPSGSFREPDFRQDPRMYTLTRTSDGTRKQGEISIAVTVTEDGWFSEEHARPRVGVQLLVGEMVTRPGPEASARITSRITRIVSEQSCEVIFETESGSIYRWVYVRPTRH